MAKYITTKPIKKPKDDWHSRNPNKSSWLGAFILSGTWTTVYFLVFFVFTWIMNLSTPVITLLVGLWLSVIAESIIRYQENSDKSAKWNKPLSLTRKGDNRDFPLKRAIGLIAAGMLIFAAIFFVLDRVYGIDLASTKGQALAGEVSGQGDPPTPAGFKVMLCNWGDSIYSPVFILGSITCVVMRAFIYKRKKDTQ